VEDITLIVAKEIITLTIVKVTEVRVQEVCAKEARAKEVRVTKETSMDVDVKQVTSIVSDSQMMAKTIGALPGQQLPSDITTVINLIIQILHRRTTSSTAPLQPLWSRTMLATNSTRRRLWSIPVPRGTCSTIYPSSTNSSLSHMSDGRRLRLSQVLYMPRLAINLLSVSQPAKKGIMTSFTKTGCALIDSDDGNCLLAEASITPCHGIVFCAAYKALSVSNLCAVCFGTRYGPAVSNRESEHFFECIFTHSLGINKNLMKRMGRHLIIISSSTALDDTLTLEEDPGFSEYMSEYI
jgi:hypothetical protein